MVFKVLLGLLAAVAVTGSAVMYSASSHTCPLTGGCTASAVADSDSSACQEEQPSCCAGLSRAKLACCSEGEEATAAGGDAVAALTGGIGLAR